MDVLNATACVPDPVLGTRNAAVNKTDAVRILMELTDICWGIDVTRTMK